MPFKSAAHLFAVEEPAETPFYIAATQQAATRPPRVLKYGDTFIVLDSRGDISATSGGSAGLFHLDTRYLSRLELLVNAVHPLLLGSNLRDDNSAFSVDLSNPDLMADQRIVLEKDTVHILRTMFLWHGTFTINSLSHLFGKRRFPTTDTSKNNWMLALVTLGEGWHNNHHHYMASARQGFYWWEVDITFYALKVLSWFHIVRDLRKVPEHVLAEGQALAAAA